MNSFLKFGFAAAVFCSAAVVGCLSTNQKAAVTTGLQIADYSCIVAKAALPVAQIQTGCQLAEDVIPAIEAVLKDLQTHDSAKLAACQGQGSAK